MRLGCRCLAQLPIESESSDGFVVWGYVSPILKTSIRVDAHETESFWFWGKRYAITRLKASIGIQIRKGEALCPLCRVSVEDVLLNGVILRASEELRPIQRSQPCGQSLVRDRTCWDFPSLSPQSAIFECLVFSSKVDILEYALLVGVYYMYL